MKIKSKITLALLSFLAISTYSKNSFSSEFSKGGILLIHNEDEPKVINPLFNDSSNARNIYNLIFSGLVGIDDNFNYFPDLAVSVPSVSNKMIESNGEGMIVTYKIKENANWHDGLPVTSDDIRFTWEAFSNHYSLSENKQLIEGYKQIYKVETPNPKLVKLYFKKKYNDFNRLFRYVLPKHAFANRTYYNLDINHPFNKKPFGSGPFKFLEWEKNKSLIFDANKHFYRQRAHLDQIRVVFQNSTQKIVNDFKSSKLHLLSPKTVEKLSKNQVEKLNFIKVPEVYFEDLSFNTDSKLLKDKLLRKALVHSINKDNISLNDSLDLSWSSFHPNSPSYNNDLKSLYGYNLDLTDYYLNKADWTIDREKGLRAKSGELLILKLLATNSPFHKKVAKYLQDNWSYLGIKLEIDLVKQNDFAKKIVDSKNYDIVLAKKRLLINGKDRLHYYGSNYLAPNGFNFSRVNNPEIDLVLNDLSKSEDQKYQQSLSEIINENIYSLPLFQYRKSLGVSNKLNNFRPNLVYGNTWNSSEWWISE